jgi:hypothetical protein
MGAGEGAPGFDTRYIQETELVRTEMFTLSEKRTPLRRLAGKEGAARARRPFSFAGGYQKARGTFGSPLDSFRGRTLVGATATVNPSGQVLRATLAALRKSRR